MKTFRLIRSHPASAAYNMALDVKMFRRYAEDGVPSLRIYSWTSPSFTYGVSQHPEAELDTALCSSEGVEVVKRMTGGGVLLHDNEITYSFVCSKDDVGEPEGIVISYREICSFLIRFYLSLGLKAHFALNLENFKDKCAPHNLCSASYEKYDIVIGGKKIGGNAQKRSRHAVFQHGSIPIKISWEFLRRYAKSLPDNLLSSITSLSDEIKDVPARNVLENNLIEAFKKEFKVKFQEEGEDIYEARMAK